MSRLFIHVGPPKTGTSAIQHVLRMHDDSVVFYPKVGLWQDGSHHNLVYNFFCEFERPEVVRADAQVSFSAIGIQARATGRDVVISSEALAERDVGAFARALLYHLGMCSAEILVVCREHFERAASLYNQRVKDSFYCETRDPDTYLTADAQRLCYGPMLERLKQSGIPVRVINYHPSHDLVARYLRQVGFTGDAVPTGEARNVSLSVKGLVLTLAINRAVGVSQRRATLFEAVRRMRGFYARSQFIFKVPVAAKTANAFQEDRARLAQNYGVDLPFHNDGRKNLFFLSKQERDEIAVVCRDIMNYRAKIMEFVDPYVSAV